jgi:hypothetical protein
MRISKRLIGIQFVRIRDRGDGDRHKVKRNEE